MILGIQRSISIDQAGLRDVTAPFLSHAWEQRKLGSVIEERNIQQAQSRKYPLVSFTVEQGVTPKTKRYEREQLVVGDKASKKYKITEYNDIVYNPANLKFGAISRNTYGNAVFSPIYVTFVVDPEVASPSFIGLFVTRQDFIQRSLMYQQGTVYERQSVNPEDLLSMNCYLPSRPEQESISLLFRQLDYLIALHQRKLSHLRQLKKCLLQKMFPKPGEDRPEVRFPGFADAWEQRKLGDLFSERIDRSGDGELISVTINSGVIKASELDRKDNSSKDKSNYKKVEIGDIAYNSMRMWQGASGRSPYAGILSPAYTVIVPKAGVDSSFFAYDFKRYKMIQLFQRNSQGLTSDTWNLKYPTLKTILVFSPSLDEQKAISKYFDALENLITLHQRKQLNI